jgi:hypothetical protein
MYFCQDFSQFHSAYFEHSDSEPLVRLASCMVLEKRVQKHAGCDTGMILAASTTQQTEFCCKASWFWKIAYKRTDPEMDNLLI